jgi:tRNA pseudouridine55 synthase
MEHEVDQTYPTAHITEDRIRTVLADFVGDIQQVPPQYSACKIGGDRAYDLKRKGVDVELKAKTVHVEHIELISYDAEKQQLSIRVECGKGTYIRSLARDIGRALDSGAYLTALCRTRLGNIRIEECITIDDFPQWLENIVITQ